MTFHEYCPRVQTVDMVFEKQIVVIQMLLPEDICSHNMNSFAACKYPQNAPVIMHLIEKHSIRDACTPQPEEIVFNTMIYRRSEPVHRLGYFQSSV